MIDTDKYEGHTEGPWVIEIVQTDHAPHGEDLLITSIHDELDDDVCVVEIVYGGNNRLRAKEDARLIADAPLLLERVIHLEHIVKCARDVLTNIYTYDKDLEDAEWIAWFCDMESEEE